MKKYELDSTEINIKETINQDILHRNTKLFNLIRMINNIHEHFIISIDGDWGTGKTFFVKQLQYLVNNHNEFKFISQDNHDMLDAFAKKNFIIYYNAWESDDHVNPLESIIYYMLNEYPGRENDVIEGRFDIVKEILKNIIEKGSLGFIKKEDFDTITTFRDLADNIYTLEEKKQLLDELFKNLIQDDERILLIIDELDRCKPDYAVKLLETIKHFFNNSSITILVVTNNAQLAHTVKKFYGYDFNGYNYLNKIYDIVITLGNENIRDYVQNRFGFFYKTYLPENVSIYLFDYFNFSYREVNKYIAMYKLIEPYTRFTDGFDENKKYITHSDIFLPIAIALKIRDIEQFNIFVRGEGIEILRRVFNLTKVRNQVNLTENWLRDLFAIHQYDDLEEAIIKEYLNMFEEGNIIFRFPFVEAISMLGDSIQIKD